MAGDAGPGQVAVEEDPLQLAADEVPGVNSHHAERQCIDG